MIYYNTQRYTQTNSIENYTGSEKEVFDKSEQKWFMLNNLGDYEEYGLYEEVSDLSAATYYDGKIVYINGNNIRTYYQYENGEWVNKGDSVVKTILSPEYIERSQVSQGSFYLDYYINSNTKMFFGMKPLNLNGGGCIIGDGNNGDAYRVFYYQSSFYFDITGSRIQQSISGGGQNFYDYEIGNYYFKVRNNENIIAEKSTTAKNNFTSEYNLQILGRQFDSTTPNDFCQITYFKLYDGEDLLFDLIPAYKDESYCFYNKVDDSYLTPSALVSGSSTMNNVEIGVQSPVSYIEKSAPNFSKLIINVLHGSDIISRIKQNGLVVYDTVIPNYFKLTALEPGTINMDKSSKELYWSTNGKSWTLSPTSESTISVEVTKGTNLYLKGSNTKYYYNLNGAFKTSTCNYNVSGNIMSLFYDEDFEDKVSFPENNTYTLSGLFRNDAHLINAKDLLLPATTFNNHCYENMFISCTSLVTAPELPALSLPLYAYSGMFSDCTSLTTAPALPATNLSSYCYTEMFVRCYNLTTAPTISATRIPSYGCQYMFVDCTSLVTAPELPATYIDSNGYREMFRGCTSLVTAPELHSTGLYSNSYNRMFEGCTSLTTVPYIAFTNYSTYSELGRQMFYNCRSLNYIKVNFSTFKYSNNNFQNWVYNVAGSGTFVLANNSVNWDTEGVLYGNNGIPTNWTVKDSNNNIITPKQYVEIRLISFKTYTYEQDDVVTLPAATVTVNNQTNVSDVVLSYSSDNQNWSTTTPTIDTTTIQTLNYYVKAEISNSPTYVDKTEIFNITVNVISKSDYDLSNYTKLADLDTNLLRTNSVNFTEAIMDYNTVYSNSSSVSVILKNLRTGYTGWSYNRIQTFNDKTNNIQYQNQNNSVVNKTFNVDGVELPNNPGFYHFRFQDEMQVYQLDGNVVKDMIYFKFYNLNQ